MLFIIGCLLFIFAVHGVFSKLEFLTCWPDFVFNKSCDVFALYGHGRHGSEKRKSENELLTLLSRFLELKKV